MLKSQPREYIDRVVKAETISADDLRDLKRRVLAEGLGSRAEVEALLALDRAVPGDPAWGDALTALVVDFVVWGRRPTGTVTADDARWLAAALRVAASSTAARIAQAIVAEADRVDGALAAFAGGGRTPSPQDLAA